MRRINGQLSLIVGGAAGALLIAAAGVSAHTTGLPLFGLVGQHHSQSSEEASGARTEPKETPEPTEKPKALSTAKPSDGPETETETDSDTQTGPTTGTDNESSKTGPTTKTEDSGSKKQGSDNNTHGSGD
jgi:hypothetical protein